MLAAVFEATIAAARKWLCVEGRTMDMRELRAGVLHGVVIGTAILSGYCWGLHDESHIGAAFFRDCVTKGHFEYESSGRPVRVSCNPDVPVQITGTEDGAVIEPAPER
jgi:hypothetical protein